MGQSLTPELRQWLVDQTALGQQPEALLRAMVRAGWTQDLAVLALDEHLPGGLASQTLTAGLPTALLPAQTQTRAELGLGSPVPDLGLSAGSREIDAGDRRVQVLASLQSPRVVVLGGFLSEAECDALVDAARPRLVRSRTVQTQTGGEELNADRTSSGMFFNRGEGALIQRIEARIARLLRWPVENGEGLQVLHYLPGAEYKPHYDYFDPAEPGTPSLLQRGGQRVATLLLYLNEPERGGGTTFPDAGLEVAPHRGHAVFFSYDRPTPATRTLHGGAPVIAGEKWVATKWLREREFN
jgi:prolyl 4-hydroxylase